MRKDRRKRTWPAKGSGPEEEAAAAATTTTGCRWLVEKLTFKHETPAAKVDAMTMARALLGMSCLLSWQSMPLLQSQHSRQQQCWANFMCVLVKKKLKIYIPMYDWFPYDCLSNCPTATPNHPPPSSFCTRLRALIDCLYAHSPSV